MALSTLTQLESLFSTAVGRTVHAGEVVETSVDLVMGHDATLALAIADFERLSCSLWDNSRMLIACDHFAPPVRSDHADLQKSVLQFAARHQVPDLHMYRGICHQLLLEDTRVQPGRIVVGADSHTLLAGAVGCFATGLGATDILGCLVTGKTWFRVPESLRVTFTGRRKPWVMGRDLALHLLGRLGESGASYQALEMWDGTKDDLAMDSRAAICCMATEMGAKAALFTPDEITRDFLQRRDDDILLPFPPVAIDEERYVDSLDIDVGNVDSLVAKPHSPANVCPVAEVKGTPLDEVFIGSCAGGRLEDFAMAAKLLAGKTVARGLKVIAVPASVTVQRQAIALGYFQLLSEAGVCLCNPSCGACGKLDKGVLATGDTVLSTSTRNFQGRMGPRDSAIYLASTATCAASAVTGYITPPADVWEEL